MGSVGILLLTGTLLQVAHTLTEITPTPVVTLDHGGQLRGRQLQLSNVTIDLFLGIRYVQAPVGKLRFKKPEFTPTWKGIRNVTTTGSSCSQYGSGGLEGDEDCLYMDITVPGGVQQGNKKPVMVWIHGGAYMTGSGSMYFGAPLTIIGDVLFVSFNYRLGILGFLSDGPRTGNFGLWDQRAALLWVKKNIAQFGGDPDSVTIFGESAGAASVSAQMMSQHNDGLFKRAIQQSGSLFQSFSWYLSQAERIGLVDTIKTQAGCLQPTPVYDCLSEWSPKKLFTEIHLDPRQEIWHPQPDGDFFAEGIELKESYAPARRFDLLAGFNGQEGGIFLALDVVMFVKERNRSIEAGVSIEIAKEYLALRCRYWISPLAVNLCVDFVASNYGIYQAVDDRHRAIKLTDFLGEMNFNADIINQLRQHSKGNATSTYAYYFEALDTSNTLSWKIPSWAKRSADHGEELFYLFAAVDLTKSPTSKEWLDIYNQSGFLREPEPANKPLTLSMMQMWTNFARAGNPNQPKVVADMPTWPEFNGETNKFLQMNTTGGTVITTPFSERIDRVIGALFTTRRRQSLADRAPINKCPTPPKPNNVPKVPSDGGGNAPMIAPMLGFIIFSVLVHCLLLQQTFT